MIGQACAYLERSHIEMRRKDLAALQERKKIKAPSTAATTPKNKPTPSKKGSDLGQRISARKVESGSENTKSVPVKRKSGESIYDWKMRLYTKLFEIETRYQ